MKVRHGRGTVSYTGPESCACSREAASEALNSSVLTPEALVRLRYPRRRVSYQAAIARRAATSSVT